MRTFPPWVRELHPSPDGSLLLGQVRLQEIGDVAFDDGLGPGDFPGGFDVPCPEVAFHPGGDGDGSAFVVDGGIGQRAGEADRVPGHPSPYGSAQGSAVHQRTLGPRTGTPGPFLCAEETAAFEIAVEFIGQLDAEVVEDIAETRRKVHVFLSVSIFFVLLCHGEVITVESTRPECRTSGWKGFISFPACCIYGVYLLLSSGQNLGYSVHLTLP